MNDRWKLIGSLSREEKRARLAALLIKRLGADQADSAAVDLDAEAVLDASICSGAMPATGLPFHPRAVFLTGATGLLGGVLLHELLCRTEATIHCLVRASSKAEGLSRLRKSLALQGVDIAASEHRIAPVLGDLTRPLLGLTKERFNALASAVDVVFHSAATVNWVQPYEMLKPANVNGTREVVRLACQERLKPLHYVSTLGVLLSADDGDYSVVREDSSLEDHRRHYMGYIQTKWVSERLISQARERGLPVAVYRPPFIGGHSVTGAYNVLDDFVCRQIKSCTQIGIANDRDFMVPIVPADHIGKAIVEIARRPGSFGRCFHFANPETVRWSEIFEWMERYGYPVRRIPLDAWIDAILKAGTDNALYPLMWLFTEKVPEENRTLYDIGHSRNMSRIDCANTEQALAGTAICNPPLTEKLIRTYLDYFVRIGFIDPPRSAPRSRE